MLFATLPHEIRSRLLIDHKEKLGQKELRKYINRITETITPRGEHNNPMSHLMHQMTQNNPQGQTQTTQSTNSNKAIFNGTCYRCNNYGHRARDCKLPQPPKPGFKQMSQQEQVVKQNKQQQANNQKNNYNQQGNGYNQQENYQNSN